MQCSPPGIHISKNIRGLSRSRDVRVCDTACLNVGDVRILTLSRSDKVWVLI